MEAESNSLPHPVIQRLPKYLTHVRELRNVGVIWVSSHQLAGALGLTSSTVRQDLSHLRMRGVSKRGYETSKLELVLRRELGADTRHRLVIVGAGYMGCALALHAGLLEQGFETVGVFDTDVELVGTKVGLLQIRPMDALEKVVKDNEVDIGIIAVPASAAQDVANRLAAAGVKGLLNLAYVHIRVPRHVALMDARIIANLQQLAYVIRTQNGVASTADAFRSGEGNS